MTADAMQLDSPSTLPFERSESRAVGAEGPMMKMLRDNAPRVVGILKLPMDILIAFTGSPWLIGYAAFAIVGRLIMITYGNKQHQDKLARQAGAHDENEPQAGIVHKVTHPSQYPVESAAGFSVVGEALGIGYGPELLAEGKPAGYMVAALGALAVWLYANILFSKEKKSGPQEQRAGAGSESLNFAQSQSRHVGFGGNLREYMKNNPMVISSLAAISISLIGMVGGFIGGASIFYVAALACGLVANVVQLLLVRKNDYNIEGAKERVTANESAQQRPVSFQDRIAVERQDMALAPRLAT